MDVNAAIAEVQRITNRPDKVVAILTAINRALSFCVMKGEFEQDVLEKTFTINSSLYGDTISLITAPNVLTRFRRFKYLKPTGALYYIKKLDSDKLFTPGGFMQTDKYFLQGTNLTYTLSKTSATLECAYYTYPLRLDTTVNMTHWILDMAPDVIIELASAKIFNDIGDETSANRYQASGLELYQVLKADQVQP
jgi:hypothetical protein